MGDCRLGIGCTVCFRTFSKTCCLCGEDDETFFECFEPVSVEIETGMFRFRSWPKSILKSVLRYLGWTGILCNVNSLT